MTVTASLVVKFGSDAVDNAQLLAEVDGRDLAEGGLNQGRTQFLPGDRVAYLVYRYLLSTTEHRSSAGTINAGGNGQRQVEEVLTFFDSSEAQVRYPIYTLDSVEWLGNDLGSMVASGGQAVRAATPGVGVAIVKYTTRYDIFWLNSPTQINGRENFDIAILVVGSP